MNTKFQVLWIEDNPSWYKSACRKIEEILGKHSLRLNAERRRDASDNVALCSNCYDLILVDYALANSTTGDQIINIIRESNILTDIIFYSSEFDTMIEQSQRSGTLLDGVYYSDRNAKLFYPKVERLIEKLIKRSEDPVNLRGFVMENSSEFETVMTNMSVLMWGKIKPEHQDALNSAVLKILDGNERYCSTEIAKARESASPYLHTIDQHALMTARYKIELLSKQIEIMIQHYGLPDKDEYHLLCSYYGTEFSPYRNKLAHITSKDSVIRVNGTDVSIDASLHEKMRTTILKIEIILAEIESHILQM